MPLIGGSIRVSSGGEAQTLVGGVEVAVKALEECITVDEVKALARVGAEVTDDEVYSGASAAYVGVERTGPDLRVRCQRVGN